ncbi:GGDEF-domain containing protein [Loktanella sp. D2R18]|uniref:putative bifunctional diguanylate cyclase/phosphodiesterase n=1 Tax=Rhodobacterales TaxID=204455 RepID=UPI000DE94C73|nr:MULTISPECIES: bifunctional diguanylate cyclase/phosphodiesterase [Rhodobacterales]MDO6590387.1 bifunctional diguanylate cyclase/phosphodiesterase [Yoonia sp. 1_MG-2023]RBW41116.1 GGDEF-domain containing protein [Loktanella sp. D2R18]
MQFLRPIAHRARKIFTLRRPERLWIHSCAALLIILALLGTTQYINHTIIDRQLIAETGIKTSQSQITYAHEILLIAERMTSGRVSSAAPIEKAIKQFERSYAMTVFGSLWTDEQRTHYFGSAEPLHALIAEFVDISSRFSTATPAQYAGLTRQLNDLYTHRGLGNGLDSAAALMEQEAHADAIRLSKWQRSVLIVSALALLAEAIFIFVPTHLAVQSTIGKLHRQTKSLRDSQHELRQMNRKLEHTAHQDPLTGLPNRAHLATYLGRMNKEEKSIGLSVLFVGLDNFKAVNNSAGHDFGDELLITVGRALQSCVDDDNIVARVGGDEFVLVTHEPAHVMIERIRALFADPFEVKGRRIPIHASIGYLKLATNSEDPINTIADASIAIQTAKNSGENKTLQFEKSLRDNVERMRSLQAELANAIKQGEIEPWFQPQVRLSDGHLHGAEVLARWRHPTLGLLTPDLFIPAAERAGLVIDMDHSIWRAAMAHAVLWQKENLWHPSISLNAAPETISDPHLIERLLLELQRSGLGVDQIIVEVLETTLINGADDMAAINIDSLSECGISLELDDFGTGYASLAKLTQLPLDGIKLDRSLVAPLPDAKADSIVRAILALASELGLQVIAEGVEEDIQATHLNARGCAVAQGYGYAKPMPAEEFRVWLKTHANAPLHIAPRVAQVISSP